MWWKRTIPDSDAMPALLIALVWSRIQWAVWNTVLALVWLFFFLNFITSISILWIKYDLNVKGGLCAEGLKCVLGKTIVSFSLLKTTEKQNNNLKNLFFFQSDSKGVCYAPNDPEYGEFRVSSSHALIVNSAAVLSAMMLSFF